MCGTSSFVLTICQVFFDPLNFLVNTLRSDLPGFSNLSIPFLIEDIGIQKIKIIFRERQEFFKKRQGRNIVQPGIFIARNSLEFNREDIPEFLEKQAKIFGVIRVFINAQRLNMSLVSVIGEKLLFIKFLESVNLFLAHAKLRI